MSDPEPVGRRIDALEDRVDEHDRIIAGLNTSILEMRATLGHVATKEDIHELKASLEHEIGGVLGRALNSVPAWQAAAWAGVAAAIGIVAMLHAIHIL